MALYGQAMPEVMARKAKGSCLSKKESSGPICHREDLDKYLLRVPVTVNRGVFEETTHSSQYLIMAYSSMSLKCQSGGGR